MLICRRVAAGYFLLAFPVFCFFELPREYSHPKLAISSEQLQADARNFELPVLNANRFNGFSMLMVAIILSDHVAASTLLTKNVDSLFALPETIKNLKPSEVPEEIQLRDDPKKKKRRKYDVAKIAQFWKNQIEVPVVSLPPVDEESEETLKIRTPRRRKASKTRSEGGGIPRPLREKSSKEHKASRTKSLPNKSRVVKLKVGPHPADFIDTNPYVKGNTALHIAVILDEQFLITTLLVLGDQEQIMQKNIYGNTPLHEAVLRGNWAALSALLRGPLEAESNQIYVPKLSEALNMRNKQGVTPLDGLMLTTQYPSLQDPLFFDVTIIDLIVELSKSGAHINEKMGPTFLETPLEYCDKRKLAKLSAALMALRAPHADGAFQAIQQQLDGPLENFLERLKIAPNLPRRELFEFLRQKPRKPRSQADIFGRSMNRELP